ncbi:MAG TPA: hypothetical protein VFL73_01670 [Solirubrobacteraceae bacterium]|jgi:hypothetical protein|nr:hypothetical protein [Solirubrobacteraceae bacterium]
MAWKTRLLVVANRTADSEDLLTALRERAARGPIAVTLIVPQDTHGGLGERLTAALSHFHEAGIDAHGMLGDTDPAVAVLEAWDPGAYDEVMVATLPGASSRWLTMDLPGRIARMVDAPVTHVIAREARTPSPMSFA